MISPNPIVLGGFGLASALGQVAVGEPLQNLFVQAPLIAALIYLWIFESKRRTQDETKRDERFFTAFDAMSARTADAITRQSESTDRLNVTLAAHGEILRRLEEEIQ